MSQRVPVLVYHHVYPDGHPELGRPSGKKATGVIAESDFRRQMEHVKSGGWEAISTTRLVDWIEGREEVPARSVVIHFDNGWLDAWTMAMPIVKEYGLTATSFVITDGTAAATEGRAAAVTTSTEGAVQKPFITWAHAEGLLEEGWEIGAHSSTHPKFAELHDAEGDEGVLEEVASSSTMFEQRLGFVPQHFAYPSGSRNDRTDALLAPHYRSLRLWEFSSPPRWTFTDRQTPLTAIACQNVDSTVPFDDFARIFSEAG